jgi:hypothetical protein
VDDLQRMMEAGYGGALFDYNDPYLAQAIYDARAAGIPFGIWGDPNAVGNNNVAFASRMAQLNAQYQPDMIVPDLEQEYKGYEGSAGWQKSQELAALWAQYLPGVRTAVTPMGNQRDFNYEAWQALGETEWLPQAYGGNSNAGGEAFDPKTIVQTLIERGVDPSLISPILAAAHGGQGYGGAGLWTIDDFIGKTLPKASGPAAPSPAGGNSAAPTTSTSSPGRTKPALSFLGQGYSQGPAQIEKQGLQWFGQNFGTQQAFAKELQSRGKNYAQWAAQHQPAAQALAGR